MSADNRPNVSIWGTILSTTEIALGIYQVFAEKGKGLMISAELGEVLGKAAPLGTQENGYHHFDADSTGEQAAVYELIKNKHVTDPDAIKQYGTAEAIEADGRYTFPEYFGSLPEPEDFPEAWGTLKENTPIDNGVFFIAGEQGNGIAIHKTVADYDMGNYARWEHSWIEGEYLFYDLDKSAAIAIFELANSHQKVIDFITSWESLMYTLATKYPDYTADWNSQCSPDNIITDIPAPPFMFLQRHLDEAAAQLSIEPEQDLTTPYVVAYCNGESVLLQPSARNIATFMVQYGVKGDIQMTDYLDQPLLNTFGPFIDRCTDQIFLEEKLRPVLVPMQTGEEEPPEIEYYESQQHPHNLSDEPEDDDEIVW